MKNLKCSTCNKRKPEAQFHVSRTVRSGRQSSCIKCQDKKRIERRQQHKAAGVLTYHQRYRRRLRWEVLSYYSKGDPKCACCGENHFEFLAVDHINGSGTKHRKQIGGSSYFYSWLKREGFPKGYRVLCHNCNQALGIFGYCPHQTPVSKLMQPPTVSRSVLVAASILKAARFLVKHRRYPGLKNVSQKSGRCMDAVCRWRKRLIQSGEWPKIQIRKNRWG